jgi:long-chain acyl-CoA synthetase
MSESSWLLDRLSSFGEQTALVWNGHTISYAKLRASVDSWMKEFEARAMRAGDCVAFQGDYSPDTCALLIALITHGNIAVPLASTVKAQREEFLQIAEADGIFEFEGNELKGFQRLPAPSRHPLMEQLRSTRHPGLILFSSGSTGKSKASLLDFERLLEKFKRQRPGHRTLTFLLLDHIGGLNTLLHTLTSGGTVVTTPDRSADAVCRTIQEQRIQLLPTTPTFLKMLLISDAYKRYDLSSLEVITYGTEPMPTSTLEHLHQVLPKVVLKQTYGLSELGILQTKSKDSASLLVKVGGEGYETKVVDNILWIRARSAMLGYLNAPSPFDAEGWFNTGDLVEVEGEYLRILGRKSEIINVGGEKVYPAEVESVLLEMDNVRDAVVSGKLNPVTGNVVVAKLLLDRPEDPVQLRRRVREFCKDRLAPYKVPAFVELVDDRLHNDRFKKARV